MKKIILSIAIAMLICSCSSIVKNNENLMTLKTGMTQDEVYELMGVPSLSELYEAADDNIVSILYYRTKEEKTTVLSAKDECTPVVFVNNQLVGWGDRLMASSINQLKVKTK